MELKLKTCAVRSWRTSDVESLIQKKLLELKSLYGGEAALAQAAKTATADARPGGKSG